MTPKQAAAAKILSRALSDALGTDKPRLTKQAAGELLAEVLGAHQANGGVSSLDHDIPRSAPMGSAYAKARAALYGEIAETTGHSLTPSDELQAAIDAGVARALANRGIS